MRLQTKCSLVTILVVVSSVGLDSEEVCSLTDDQTKKLIQTFSKIAVILREPRCVNCHGAIDPFARNTKHGGGQLKQDDDCLACHINPKIGWVLPPPSINFVRKSDFVLCGQMKDFIEPKDFADHIEHDNRRLIDVSFEGTRGLNDTGQALVDNYKPIPPSITHSEFNKRARDWADEWPDLSSWDNKPSCGCKRKQYALQLHYKSSVQSSQGVATVQEQQEGQTDVPLEFHPQGEFSGNGTLSAVVKGFMTMQGGGCQFVGLNQMTVRVEGKVDQESKKIHIKTAWASPGTHTTGTCTMDGQTISQSSPGNPFDSSSLHDPLFNGFDMKDEVGTALTFNFPMMPEVTATVDTKLIEMDSEPVVGQRISPDPAPGRHVEENNIRATYREPR